MKIAISAQGNDLDSLVDPRFGRARWFVIADTENGEWRSHDNAANADAAHGAGVRTGEAVAGLGVEAVVTGDVGPNAFRVLEAASVRIMLTGGGTVREALQLVRDGALPQANTATVPERGEPS